MVVKRGQIYGQLTVLRKTKPYKSPKGRLKRRWLCTCYCGNTTVVKEDHLKTGHTKSCGCMSKQALVEANNRRKAEGKGTRRPKLSSFRHQVLTRDKHRCQVCEAKSNLQVHHLYNYMNHQELADDINNGITLCQKCHSNFHLSLGGFAVACTTEDFINWLPAGKSDKLPTILRLYKGP